MTEKEIRLWMLGEGAKDSWLMHIDEKSHEDAVTLAEAADQAAANPEAEVQLLHVSQAEVKEPPWVIVAPYPIMRPEQRETLQAIKNKRWKSIIIQVAALLLIIVLATLLLLPEPIDEAALLPRPSAKERLLNQLAQIDDAGESQGAVVNATVARTGRILFISNQNSATWPSCEVALLDGDDSYVYQFAGPLDSKLTLQIPLREFKKEGVAYPADVNPKDITIIVPGYRVWEDSF